jgi:hypothetical protein
MKGQMSEGHSLSRDHIRKVKCHGKHMSRWGHSLAAEHIRRKSEEIEIKSE